MEDRRRYKRIKYEKNIRCNIIDGGGFCDTIKRTINISGGGIRVFSERPFSVNEPVALEMHVPGYLNPVYVKGDIRWSREAEGEGYSSGIQFRRIDSSTQELILEYVHFSE